MVEGSKRHPRQWVQRLLDITDFQEPLLYNQEGNILLDYWDLKTREIVYGMQKQEVSRSRGFHIEFKQENMR
jgi:leucyl-tRNA synthetase